MEKRIHFRLKKRSLMIEIPDESEDRRKDVVDTDICVHIFRQYSKLPHRRTPKTTSSLQRPRAGDLPFVLQFHRGTFQMIGGVAVLDYVKLQP